MPKLPKELSDEIKRTIEEGKVLEKEYEEKIDEVDGRIYGTSNSKRSLWDRLELSLTSNAQPFANVDNAIRVISGITALKEAIWWDDFQKRVFTTWNGQRREWADEDDIELLQFMQNKIGLARMAKPVVRDALDAYAKRNRRNEFVEWLDELKWDGIERCSSFFSNYIGASFNEYTSIISQNFWVGLVARGLKPGCKLDNMVVLIGKQATKKTQAIEIIGGKWHIEVNCSIRDKDFLQGLHGKLLVDIGELASFGKADNNFIKSILTTKNDYYRESYGHRHRDHFRSCCLIASTNDQEFLDDVTGGRRYWPIEVGNIDLDALRKDRSQLFAEAYKLYQSGATWWEVPEVAKMEQEKRRKKDAWEEIIANYLVNTSCVIQRITVANIATDCLEISISDLDKGKQMRIANALKSLGYFKTHDKLGNFWVKAGEH